MINPANLPSSLNVLQWGQKPRLHISQICLSGRSSSECVCLDLPLLCRCSGATGNSSRSPETPHATAVAAKTPDSRRTLSHFCRVTTAFPLLASTGPKETHCRACALHIGSHSVGAPNNSRIPRLRGIKRPPYSCFLVAILESFSQLKTH